MIALIVTLACLPLLVIDMVSASSSSGASESAVATEQVPDPSLVVAASPSIESTSTTEAAPATDLLAGVSPSTTTAPRVVFAAPAAPAVPAATTTTTAPRPVVTAPPMNDSDAAFLACVRWRESHGDYTASDPSGTYLGAYQIYQGGWDSIASSIGRFDLVGVPPNHASAPDQDEIAAAMLRMSGRSPWGGYCG